MKLTSKTAVVSGVSRGLGKEIAKTLVRKGTRVFGLARSTDSLSELRQLLGENFIPISLDITDQQAVAQWISETFSEETSPDILINNAGSGSFGEIEDLPLEKWKQMIDTNLNGMYYLTRGLVPFMRKNPNHCHIINIGSILGKTSGETKSAYSATKYALQGFNEALFKELRKYDIKVSLINPGSIETEFFSDSGIESHSRMLQPKDLADTIVHVLETPDNVLIDELTIRPLNARKG